MNKMRWNDNNIYPSSRQTFFTWSEIFEDYEDFIDKVIEVGGDSDNLQELYRILINKYVTSTTRYNMEEAFIYAIRRELEVAWPMYLAQKKIVTDMIELDMEQLRTEMETIRETNRSDLSNSEVISTGTVSNTDTRNESNTIDFDTQRNTTDNTTETNDDSALENVVNANTGPVVNADTIAVKDKSNIQTSNINKRDRDSSVVGEVLGIDKTTIVGSNIGGSDTTSGADIDEMSSFDSEGLERYKQLGNDLEALTTKYEAIRRDYLAQIYRKMDPLFRVIL